MNMEIDRKILEALKDWMTVHIEIMGLCDPEAFGVNAEGFPLRDEIIESGLALIKAIDEGEIGKES